MTVGCASWNAAPAVLRPCLDAVDVWRALNISHAAGLGLFAFTQAREIGVNKSLAMVLRSSEVTY